MAYVDGFIAAVPNDAKAKFLEHAETVDALFMEHGATRVVEGWGDDVSHGKQTDFFRAVKAGDDETVVFSWIEWPDKATRDAAMAKMQSDDRMMGPMPFDGKRMIYGGFAPILDYRNGGGKTGYVDGFLIAVPNGNKQAYHDMATVALEVFKDCGATRVVEGWGDDVPDGTTTDMKRAVEATGDENVVFSFVEWPDKATRDKGAKAMMEDERMQPDPAKMPFDGKRMIYAGFEPIFEREA
jgi:uncharacterized protein YbaA (DUF1428 family)